MPTTSTLASAHRSPIEIKMCRHFAYPTSEYGYSYSPDTEPDNPTIETTRVDRNRYRIKEEAVHGDCDFEFTPWEQFDRPVFAFDTLKSVIAFGGDDPRMPSNVSVEKQSGQGGSTIRYTADVDKLEIEYSGVSSSGVHHFKRKVS